MHKSINNLVSIEEELKSKFNDSHNVKIIAVSKTFSQQDIMPLIDHGHKHFGENKVQEAVEKWREIKNQNTTIKLHLIGKLQTNKVKYVIPLFDFVHSLDSLKLAEKISKEQKRLNKYLKHFIQVNIGDEDQKSGIQINAAEKFYDTCKNELELDIVGLMCIPPVDQDSEKYFSEMQKLKIKLKLKELSMGMSADYLKAIKFSSSFVRIGSKIFGERT